MTSLIDVVDRTAMELYPNTQTLPLALSIPFELFHRAHCMWAWGSWGKEIFSSRGTLLQYGFGVTVNHISKNRLLHLLAKVALISRRAIDAVKQRAQFGRAYQKWRIALSGQQLPMISQISVASVPQGKWSKYLSPSSYLGLIKIREKFKQRIHYISQSTLNLCIEAYKLSMCYMDLIAATSISDANQNSAMNLIFVNISYEINELANNTQLLVDALEDSSPFVPYFMQALLTEEQAKKVVSGMQKVLGTYDKLKDLIHTIQSLVQSGEIWVYEKAGQLIPPLLNYAKQLKYRREEHEHNPFSYEAWKSRYESRRRCIAHSDS